MNELAMNLAAERIHNGYFEVFIVSQAAIADVLCKLLAVRDRFRIRLEFGTDAVAHRNAVFHVEEKSLHLHYLAWLYRSFSSTVNGSREVAIGKGLPRLRALL